MQKKTTKKAISSLKENTRERMIIKKDEIVCECVPTFFSSRFPSLESQTTWLSAPSNFVFKFDDVVYNVTNNPSCFSIDTDGALLITGEGSYMINFDLGLYNLTGTTTGCTSSMTGYTSGCTSGCTSGSTSGCTSGCTSGVTTICTSWGNILNAATVTLAIETPIGYSPYSTQQKSILFEPLMSEHFNFQTGRFHASALIHVGEPTIGIAHNQVRLEAWLSADGNISFIPEMYITITKL